MSDRVLDPYIRQLSAIFRAALDKREAHRKSRDVLHAMSTDAAVLPAVFRKHIETPGSFDTKHYPVVGMNIALNPDFNLVANCWITLPGGETNVSTKAIHHHGDMLLTTATAFGPGYEHWTFQTPEVVDAERELYALRLIERAAHPLHHVAFVDSYIAHVPMYPASLSITLALWSSRKPTTWKDRVKRIDFLKRRQDALRRLARRVGMVKALDLKIVEYFDFFPTEAGFKGMKERQEFGRGPNEDYLYSLFHILQETGNEGLAPVVRRQLTSVARVANPRLVESLLGDLEAGRRIPGRLSEGHYGIPFANFSSEAIEQALEASRPAPAVGV